MQILKKTESINWAIEALDDMPGIGRKSAERILAETGVEMEHFQNESRFSSCWNTKQAKLSLLPLSKNCRAQRWEKGFNCSSPYHVNRDLSYTKRESSLS